MAHIELVHSLIHYPNYGAANPDVDVDKRFSPSKLAGRSVQLAFLQNLIPSDPAFTEKTNGENLWKNCKINTLAIACASHEFFKEKLIGDDPSAIQNYDKLMKLVNKKDLFTRTNSVKNDKKTNPGTYRAVRSISSTMKRSFQLAFLQDMIPSERTFTVNEENLWKNLKLNTIVIACTPHRKMKEVFLENTKVKTNYENLAARVLKYKIHGIKKQDLEPDYGSINPFKSLLKVSQRIVQLARLQDLIPSDLWKNCEMNTLVIACTSHSIMIRKLLSGDRMKNYEKLKTHILSHHKLKADAIKLKSAHFE